MNKRVHEIAKEQGLPAKELLAKLRAAGIEVKAVSSSVDEAVALKALGNGGPPAAQDGNGNAAAPAPRQAAPAAPKESPTPPAPKPQSSDGAPTETGQVQSAQGG